MFDKIEITGGDPVQNLHIMKIIKCKEYSDITCEDFIIDFYKVLSDEKISELKLKTT